VDKFAESLGLPGTPKIKFLSKAIVKQKKNASRAVEAAQAEAQEGGSSDESGSEEDESSSSGDEEDTIVKDTKPAKVGIICIYSLN